jgi:hypothetical protein
MLIVIGLWTFLRVMFCGSATIALENLALRHQLAVLQRSDRRPRLSRWDRILFSEAVCQELARWSYQLLCSVPPP